MQSALLEEAAKVITVPQVLINVVSRRVRCLCQGHRPLVEVKPRMGFADIALQEIIEGKVTYEEVSKSEEELAILRLPHAEFARRKKAA